MTPGVYAYLILGYAKLLYAKLLYANSINASLRSFGDQLGDYFGTNLVHGADDTSFDRSSTCSTNWNF